eukprot:1161724-Pelagomonas_calceolata.AAC.12
MERYYIRFWFTSEAEHPFFSGLLVSWQRSTNYSHVHCFAASMSRTTTCQAGPCSRSSSTGMKLNMQFEHVGGARLEPGKLFAAWTQQAHCKSAARSRKQFETGQSYNHQNMSSIRQNS